MRLKMHSIPDTLNMSNSVEKGKFFYNIVNLPVPKDGKSPQEQSKIVAKIKARSDLYPSYYHSFGLTER